MAEEKARIAAEEKARKEVEEKRLAEERRKEEDTARKAEEVAKAARESHRQWMAERKLVPVASIGPDEFADHLQPMILLAMKTGLRRGELFKLRRSDIDSGKQQVKVRAAAAKSGTR